MPSFMCLARCKSLSCAGEDIFPEICSPHWAILGSFKSFIPVSAGADPAFCKGYGREGKGKGF